MNRDKLYINGEWVAPRANATYQLNNPASATVCATAPDAGIEDMRDAIAAARNSFDKGDWQYQSHEQRIDLLRHLADGVAKRQDDLKDILIQCHGCDHTVLPFNIKGAITVLQEYVKAARNYPLTRQHPSYLNVPKQGPSSLVNAIEQRQPVGVCGLIPTWNFPLLVSLNKIAPALAMGCSVVVKPSPQGPLPDIVLAEIIHDYGLPAGVFNLITGQDPELGAELSSHPAVDMLSFTGSAAVGRKIMASGAATLKRVHLELGGKSALIVRDDANLDDVIGSASLATYLRAGQACALLTRVLVPATKQAELTAKMRAFIDANVKLGDPADPTVNLGPLLLPNQFTALEDVIAEAVAQGATLVTGGTRADTERGFYFQPTVLADVTSNMRVAQQELFAPVVCVMPYDSEEQAIEIANATEYGLSGAIFSADTGRAIEMAKRLRTGEVCINGGNHPYTPFGGFKQSGIGREMLSAGFDTFTEMQIISWA